MNKYNIEEIKEELERCRNIKLEDVTLDDVDENGNFTGQVMDRKEMHDKNLLHNEIVVFIINDKKQVLLQKRSANKRFYPNKWALCAGLVISGESIENAAIRELKEELGLRISINDLESFAEKRYTIRNSNSFTTFFYVESNLKENEFIVQEEELSEVKWFDIDKVIEMINIQDESIVIKKERLYLFEQLKKIVGDRNERK